MVPDTINFGYVKMAMFIMVYSVIARIIHFVIYLKDFPFNNIIHDH